MRPVPTVSHRQYATASAQETASTGRSARRSCVPHSTGGGCGVSCRNAAYSPTVTGRRAIAKTLTCAVRGGSPRSASPAGMTTTSGSTTPVRYPSRTGHTPGRGVGGVRDGDAQLTRRTDPESGPRCDGCAMYSQYPAIWSAKLVPPTLSPSTESVSVIVRVVYNTLEGIVNDFFVVTTTVSARHPR